MSDNVSKKEKEALEFEKEGKKYSSRSITRWKPDYDSAAVAFEKAALIFKQIKQSRKAIDCYTRCGECFYKINILFRAGQAFENAASVCRDERIVDEALELYSQAAEIYMEDGKGNRAGEALTKAGKLAANYKDITVAVEIFKKGLQGFTFSNKYYHATEAYRSFNGFLVQAKQYELAIENALEMNIAYKALNQTENMNKTFCSIVLFCLKLDDWVRADDFQKKFEVELPEYSSSKEWEIADKFLSAFENHNKEALEEAKRIHHIKYLEPSVAKLAMSMTLGSEGKVSSVTGRVRQPNKVNEKKTKLFEVEEEIEPVDDNDTEVNEEDIFDETDLT
ncbi:hypothetical protein ABK040_015140 [Willaertia magna]